MGINVLSLFDGMSCGQIALDKLGIEVDNYYASEIDKYAIQVTKKNYPETVHLGDCQFVTHHQFEAVGGIDLLIGGSPCQGFSFAGKQLNFKDPRSELFFEYVRLLRECKPKYFLLENVNMKKEYQDVISEYLGVEPIDINSNLVSAQNRRRLYWTNIPNITKPKDKGILLNDILLNTEEKMVSEKQLNRLDLTSCKEGGVKGCFKNPLVPTDKSTCLMARDYKGIPNIQDFTMAYQKGKLRRLVPIEYERLQTVPDNYTSCVSDTQRYKMLGNGWTVDVISHILQNMEL